MEETLTLSGERLRKVFNRRTVFENVSFTAGSGSVLLITGRNGSGKSTLVKIISRVLSPTAGSVRFGPGGKETDDPWQTRIGLVSPYLQMFEEFTARENLSIAMRVRGLPFDGARADGLLERVALFPRRNDPVRTYSSGMKQRMKYAFALLHAPHLLILDEPMSNLDEEGVGIVRRIMEEQRSNGILVVATNDLTDIGHFDTQVDLNERR
jgi:heme exporter protein A